MFFHFLETGKSSCSLPPGKCRLRNFQLFNTHRLDLRSLRLASLSGSGNTFQRRPRWSTGTFVSNYLPGHDSLHFFFLVYSNLGLGFASGCIIIIAEIIYAKLTLARNLQSGCGTILLLLTLSVILTTVTSWMITEYYDP